MGIEQLSVLDHRETIRHAGKVVRDGAKLSLSPEASAHVRRKQFRVIPVGLKEVSHDPLRLAGSS